ncbi:MAG: hypothetical protein FJ311_10095 [Rhodospirillales bacterium]|nr:hypothetical protein [Rhodospirillales bacterium]
MSRATLLKTSFAAGEISPRLLGRSDLAAYENGAARLRNVAIHPTGGVGRRPGLRYVATAPGAGRLAAFEFNTEQVYLLLFTANKITVFRDDAAVAEIATPWGEDRVGQLAWVQSADMLFVAHPETPVRRVTRTSHAAWTIAELAFAEKDGRIFQPHRKFAAEAVTLAPSATGGTVTLAASADVFQGGHVGARFRLQNKEVEITAVASATSATALVKETLAGTAATADWEEQAFSAVRGWPVSLCFHQDRLVLGGSRDLPNRLWLSKSADLFNFDLGTGLDDEAIEFAILSDQVNAVRAVFSGRHLQVFTSGAEWMVSGDPLTPANIQLHRQTRVGSPVDRAVPPRDVDGATVFVARTGTEVREFLYADVEQAYRATDLATLAPHLIDAPVDQDFDPVGRLLHVAMADGSIATLTAFRAEQVAAWTRQETDGAFLAVAVVGDITYVLVRRGAQILVERFDSALGVDAGLSGAADPAKTVWSGLDHLEGRTVKVVADGVVAPDAVVAAGQIALARPASSVQAGLPFRHTIEPLPPPGGGKPVRPVALTLRLKDTAALRLDAGRGFADIPFRRFGAGVLDGPAPTFTGDVTVRASGWRRGGTEPLWRIEQSTPLPFTLLSVATEIAGGES